MTRKNDGRASEDAHPMEDEINDPLGRNYRERGGRRRCTATARDGVRCGRAPIVGGFVCVMHGGASPQARQSARKRLQALVDPAIDALLRVLDSGDPCPHCGRADDMNVVAKAAQIVLDRCGFGPKATLEVERPKEDLSLLSDDELAARAEALALKARRLVIMKQGRLLPAPAEAEPPMGGSAQGPAPDEGPNQTEEPDDTADDG